MKKTIIMCLCVFLFVDFYCKAQNNTIISYMKNYKGINGYLQEQLKSAINKNMLALEFLQLGRMVALDSLGKYYLKSDTVVLVEILDITRATYSLKCYTSLNNKVKLINVQFGEKRIGDHIYAKKEDTLKSELFDIVLNNKLCQYIRNKDNLPHSKDGYCYISVFRKVDNNYVFSFDFLDYFFLLI